jgi:hypothetical protein
MNYRLTAVAPPTAIGLGVSTGGVPTVDITSTPRSTPFDAGAYEYAAPTPSAPTGVLVTPGGGLLTVGWTVGAPVPGAAVTGYTARAWTGTVGGTLVASCTTAGLTCPITGLTGGTAYYVDVVASSSTTQSNPSAPRVTGTPTAATRPSQPTGVSVSGVGSPRLVRSVAVRWTDSATGSPTSYTARAYSTAAGNTLLGSCTATTGTTGCSITGLASGITVYVSVTGTNSSGTSLPSAPRKAGATASVPSASVVSASARDRAAVITWSAPNNGGSPITRYIVRTYAGATGGLPLGPGCVLNAPSVGVQPATTCTISGLNNGDTYYVNVQAINAAGNGLYSTRAAVTPRPAPNAPRNVSVRSASTTSLAVTWQAPTSNSGPAASSYTATAYASTANNAPALATCPASAPALTCTITGLTLNTDYYISVTATSSTGTGSASSPRVRAVPGIVPGAPNLTVVNQIASSGGGGNNRGRLQAVWTAPAAAGTRPVASYTATAYTTALGTTSAGSCTVNAPALTCTITNLPTGPAGVQYWISVTATSLSGTGLPSNRLARFTLP